RGRGRAGRLLRAGAWMVAAVCAIGTAESIVRGLMQDQPVVMWRVVQSAYGAAALAAGMVMTAGVLRLTAMVASACVDRSIASLGRRVTRLPASLGRIVKSVRAQPARWAVVAGLCLWLWNARPMVGLGAMIEHRRGLGGDLPAVNFIGPKVWGVLLFESTDRYGYNYGVYSDRF